jgi:TonB-linked SusC/RagA family outer membrane protein
MKIALFFSVIVTYCWAATAESLLKTEIDLAKGNKTLQELFNEIEEKSEFIFFYNDKAIDLNQIVKVDGQKHTIQDILDNVIDPDKVKYEIVDRHVIFYKANAADNMKNVAPAPQQGRKQSISGTVTDSSGEPVIGANIIEVGTTNGTITDIDGRFSLQVENNAVIHISYISYLDQDIPTVGRTTFDIVLQEDTKTLEEVVVTAFATQKRVNVTGAISTVSGNDIIAVPVANISSILVGITPGISAVTISGEPGQDAAEIAIRGISTYGTASTMPLIVIDGIEQPAEQAMNVMNSMNPNDILGISVLKDASSTAVYGIRAANGVIIITTKRGQVGKPKVSFSSNFGFTKATNLQKGLSSYEYALFRNEAVMNEVKGYGDTPLLNYLFTEDDLWKFENNRDFTPAEVDAMNLSPEQKERLLNSPALYYGSSDAYAELFGRTAPQWQTNINVSGGTERVKYYVSLGYFDQQSITFNSSYYGVKTGSRYQRYNLRANVDIDVFKHTTFSVNSSAQFGMTQGPGTGELYDRYSNIMQIIYEGNPFINKGGITDGKLISSINYPTNSIQDELRRRTDSEISGSWLRTLLGRPSGQLYNTRIDYTFKLKHEMSYLLKGLSAQASLRYQDNFRKTIVEQTAIPVYSVRRSQTNPNELEFFGGTRSTDSFSSSSSGSMRDFYVDAIISYDGTFGLHSLGMLALGRASKYTMPSDSYNTPTGLIGTSARVTYDYDTRYMAEANIAYNGTENFAKENRFGFFPAFSLGWVASNESFFPTSNWVTFLKIRGSYGVVGNDRIGSRRYLYLPGTYTINQGQGGGSSSWSNGGNYYQFGTSTGDPNTIYRGSSEGNLGNPNVTWEKSTKTSAGIEAKFLSDRLSLVADYFSEDRKDILTTLGVIPITFGLPSDNTSPVNVGEVTNKGYEVVLGWSDRAADFSYFIEGNVTYAKNKVIYKAEAPNPYDWMNETGHSVGQRFGYKTDGYYNTLDELNSRPFFVPLNNAVTLGDIKYLDLNGDGIVDNRDMAPIGYPNRPQYNFGGKIGFSYKGFDIKAVISGTAQGSFYLTRITSPFFKRAGNAFRWQYEGRWTPEKVAAGQKITYPRAVYNADQNHYNFGPISEQWMLSSDHLRLKNLEAGYSFPASSRFLQSAGMSSLRVYVNANNIFTLFDKMKDYGIDPETKDNIGTITYVFPLTRTVVFGFSVQF